MADEDNEIVVTVDALAEAGESSVAEDPAKILAQQFQDLKADNERQAVARKAADGRAAQAVADADIARREVQVARTSVVESQYDTVSTGLAAAKQEGSAAEVEYAAAFERGDALAMAKAQRKIANAEARVVRLDEARADLEEHKKTVERQPQREAPARREAASDDPVEAYVANRKEPAQKWLRAHPEFVTDQRKNNRLLAAHHDAIAEDINEGSPEYFEHLETKLGLNKVAREVTKSNGQEKRRTSVPVAPVGNSGGGTNGGSRQVTLTPGEAKTATDGTLVWNYDDPSGQKKFRKGDPIGHQEMARRKIALTAQGAYNRDYAEQ